MSHNSEELLEWVWDSNETTPATLLKRYNQEVYFHPSYSSGTAAVRGNKPCVAGRDYFWEIEMLTPLYGTDVMVGVGSSKADLKKFKVQFGSLLGSDEESWGYSYRGILHHNGISRQYGFGYGQGCIVGVHLDMWLGTLTFFVNRKPLGVAFTSIPAQVLYPMVCSTAARSAMRVINAISYTSSLQLHCLQALGTKVELVRKLLSIPGLRGYAEKAFWLISPEDSMESDEINQFCYEDEEVYERHILLPHDIITGGDQTTESVIVNRLQGEDVLHRTTGVNVEIYLDNNLYVSVE